MKEPSMDWTTKNGDGTRSDPFEARLEIPVAGGVLNVARAGALPHAAEAVVLAVHGVTSSHRTWGSVSRALTERTRACILAPDLRGRGASATLPGPYGFAAHLADLGAVLDHVEADRAVLVGHSLGAYVVARPAAEQCEPGTNHYTLILGNSPGPSRVAAAIESAMRDARRRVDRRGAGATRPRTSPRTG
jgi:pimeloyl-ACP methyl ester carboxylesterase